MGKLILSGGGDAVQTREMNANFVRSLNEERSVLYIPLAGDESYRSYESCYEYTCSLFPTTEVTMWTDLSGKTIEDMKEFSGVYMSGGSVNKLLASLVNTGFDNVLKKFFATGGIIYGQSAGAIVLGETVKFYEKSELKCDSLKGLKGLQLLKGYAVWCHYTEKDDEMLNAYSTQLELPLITIPDGTAVVVSKDTLRPIGEEPAYVFSNEGKIDIQ